MSNVILWGLAIVGGVIGLGVVGVIILAMMADNAQRNGNNWFR